MACTGEPLVLSAVDPLNLTGVITPGPRVPAVPRRRIEIRDGLVSEVAPPDDPARVALLAR